MSLLMSRELRSQWVCLSVVTLIMSERSKSYPRCSSMHLLHHRNPHLNGAIVCAPFLVVPIRRLDSPNTIPIRIFTSS